MIYERIQYVCDCVIRMFNEVLAKKISLVYLNMIDADFIFLK